MCVFARVKGVSRAMDRACDVATANASDFVTPTIRPCMSYQIHVCMQVMSHHAQFIGGKLIGGKTSDSQFDLSIRVRFHIIRNASI